MFAYSSARFLILVIVRIASESPLYASAHLEQAKHAPLGFLNSYLNDFPSTEKCYIHCAGGYRSVIAASILKSRGIHNVVDVAGGFAAMKNAGIIVEN